MIHFMVRVRDEDPNVFLRSIASLEPLEHPHHIWVFAHQVPPRSVLATVIRGLQSAHLTKCRYDIETARPGYETLATPADHPNSIPTFYNHCLKTIRAESSARDWIFKWDGDFVATPALIDFLNGEVPKLHALTRVRLSASGNAEHYLTNALAGYGKHVFWEVPCFQPSVDIDASHVVFTHAANPSGARKAHWDRIPWWVGCPESPSMEHRMRTIVELLGPEPAPDMAAASNPLCGKYYGRAIAAEAELTARDIFLKR